MVLPEFEGEGLWYKLELRRERGRLRSFPRCGIASELDLGSIQYSGMDSQLVEQEYEVQPICSHLFLLEDDLQEIQAVPEQGEHAKDLHQWLEQELEPEFEGLACFEDSGSRREKPC